MEERQPVNDQPVASQFFATGKWLTDFITPDAPDVKSLADQLLTVIGLTDKLRACHFWVASEIKYKPFISGSLNVEGRVSATKDLWMEPSLTMAVKVGNCANKAFLLTSLVRSFLPPQDVYCVLGNLRQHNIVSGHSWVEVDAGDKYILESTRADMPPMVLASSLDRYEPVIHFNDKTVSVVPGRTALRPFSAVYVDWLRGYLDMAYIQGRK